MIKKLIFICAVLFSVVTGYAQNDYTGTFKSNSLRISPSEFSRAQFQLTYERYFNNRSSSLSIIPSIFLKENQEQTIEGWQILSEYRFYLTHLNKENQKNFLGMYNFGFYTGVYALYLDYNEDFKRWYWDSGSQTDNFGNFEKEVTAMEGGAMVGVQVDITRRIQLDFFVGGGIRYSDYSDTYQDMQPEDSYFSLSIFDAEYQGVKPKIGFSLGITF